LYIYLFETLLYLSFALTGGYILLQFIPEKSKPQLKNIYDLFQYAILAIPLFSFMSILRSALVLRDFAQDMPFVQVLLIVVKDYSYGNAWVWILILCTVMYMITQFKGLQGTMTKWVLALLWCSSILAHGWASHPASLSPFWGALSQSVHVAAVSLWLGTLLIIAWFTKGDWNWKAFVRWFTPISISSITLIIAAGLVMMFFLIDGYINSWGINYGEALLLKHLIFLPLVLLGFMNGFLAKITDNGQQKSRLQWWLRIETVIALFILITTAYMGVQEPPHEGEFEDPSPSALFTFLHGDLQDLSLQWNWHSGYVSMILIGVAAMALLFPSYTKEKRSMFVAFACIAVLFPFLGILLSVQ